MHATPPIKQTLELPENAELVRQLLERDPALSRSQPVTPARRVANRLEEV
ncbi:MAG TPA: hypothetical protein VGA56_01595 [Opitutaceae bacterium]